MSLSGLAGKVAVVTGAASGIGAATARRLAAEGSQVVCVDLNGAAASAVAEEIGDAAIGVQADVSEPRAAEAYVEAAVRHFGRLDLLHANAGIVGRVRPLVETSDREFDEFMAVNVRGVFLALAAGMRAMTRSGGGAIVCTASVKGVRGGWGAAGYVSSKHAVIGLVRTAAIEGGRIGIRVNAVCPGTVETPMLDQLSDEISPQNRTEGRQKLRSTTPLGRDGTPEELAAAVAWMLSEEVPYLNGAILTIDGGATAG